MHFDVCASATACPPGVHEKDYRWCQELLGVGIGLGLDNTQLRELFTAQWQLRGQITETLSLDALGNDEQSSMVQ